MVYGIDKFKEYFADYTGQYVFIGGTACAILLDEMGVEFRATKDLDVVLIIEEIDGAFGERFWSFIEEGQYVHKQKSSGKNQFYRFTHPETQSFPAMIELFSREPDGLKLSVPSDITPIPVDESVASLSAILLDNDYYQLLMEGKTIIDGYSVLELEYVMLFKMRAWLDLTARKNDGETIDSKDIKKHKNDILRLMMYVMPDKRIEIPKDIYIVISKTS